MVTKLLLNLVVLGVAAAVPFSMADEKSAGNTAAQEDEKDSAKDDDADSKDKSAADGKKGVAKFTAKCPVSGEAAVKEQAAAYREKEVYFCCEKCKAAFEADSAKYATKANHQLVQTKQFKQTKCPLTGGELNKEQSMSVNGVKVTFCCDMCKATMKEASKEDRLTKLFADDVFAKSFEARPAKSDSDDKAKKDSDKSEAKKDSDSKSETK